MVSKNALQAYARKSTVHTVAITTILSIALFHIASFVLTQFFEFTPLKITTTFLILALAAITYLTFSISIGDFTPNGKQIFLIILAFSAQFILLLWILPAVRPDLFAASILDVGQNLAGVLP